MIARIRSATLRLKGPEAERSARAAITATRHKLYSTVTYVFAGRPAYRPCTRAEHQAGYASMCTARQRAATGAGDAKALRSAPVMAVKIISRPAREPKPMSPLVPVRPSPKGISAATRVVWSRASLTVMCSRRKATEEIAVVLCTAWATSR